MIRRPPRSKPTGTLCPDTTLFRYEHKKTGEAGVYALYAGSENEGTWSEALARTAATMHEKNRAVLDDPSDVALADRFVEERIAGASRRSEEHTSELQSLMRSSYADFCLKKTQTNTAKQIPEY